PPRLHDAQPAQQHPRHAGRDRAGDLDPPRRAARRVTRAWTRRASMRERRGPSREEKKMSRYSLLVSLHVASVIVWLGASTTLVFLTVYARRARDGVVLGQLGALTWWMSLWVVAPASVAAAALGLEAAEVGHWPKLFFFHVGE